MVANSRGTPRLRSVERDPDYYVAHHGRDRAPSDSWGYTTAPTSSCPASKPLWTRAPVRRRPAPAGAYRTADIYGNGLAVLREQPGRRSVRGLGRWRLRARPGSRAPRDPFHRRTLRSHCRGSYRHCEAMFGGVVIGEAAAGGVAFGRKAAARRRGGFPGRGWRDRAPLIGGTAAGATAMPPGPLDAATPGSRLRKSAIVATHTRWEHQHVLLLPRKLSCTPLLWASWRRPPIGRRLLAGEGRSSSPR